MQRRLFLRNAGMTLFAPTLSAFAASPFFDDTVVWKHGEDGIAEHHVYGLCTSMRGTVLAFTEARLQASDEGEHHIVLKRSLDNGATWSDSIYIEKSDGSFWAKEGKPGKKEAWTNAAALVDRISSRIFFFYALNEGSKDQAWTRVFYRSSDDDGVTWSARAELTHLVEPNTAGWTFHMPGPGHGIQLQHQKAHNGRLLLQVWNRRAVTAPDRAYGICVIYSDDHGKTWQLGGAPGIGDGANESRLVELRDGRVLLDSRGAPPKTQRARIYSVSHDGGLTFDSPVVRTDLGTTACDSGLLAVPAANGTQRLLFSFPDSPNKRINMTVASSDDDGQSWPHKKLVYAGPSFYSDLTALRNGQIGLLYGKDGSHPSFPDHVGFARFNLEWLDR